MTASNLACRALLALLLLALPAAAARAQSAAAPYEPEVGQAGKDVVWVPTDQPLVEKMLDLARVTPRDYVIDLGSGDGRTVIAAARRGARALGIEYNPDLVELSRRNAAKAGVAERARFVRGDIFESDFSQATVVTLFLLPELNLKLRPKLLDMKPGTRVVSNSFTMGEWQADRTVKATSEEGCNSYCTAYLWIVPAKVAGTWRLAQGEGELTLKQSFQMISGTLRAGGVETAVRGRLRGEEISFTAGTARYTGRVSGDLIKGAVRSDKGRAEWSATRAAQPAT
ncbi:MAG TPA: methyltransferase domain-containing protein [Burkholderiales bacterium]|nr:methyltransferase domain-containing protein [Burkholderiales bacterium]